MVNWSSVENRAFGEEYFRDRIAYAETIESRKYIDLDPSDLSENCVFAIVRLAEDAGPMPPASWTNTGSWTASPLPDGARNDLGLPELCMPYWSSETTRRVMTAVGSPGSFIAQPDENTVLIYSPVEHLAAMVALAFD
ncbi:hypothetical protein NHN26_15750 [Rhodovulum tesquicola]|uniref:hypothetical protein n=1 Tax=Rhodovulum tesquicola TaxID=540254 RepID=UPI0020978148|nr:hypothetical protein [Rhodovulum tesquicola]MCO8146670.1 hypothetical protein [Rhodovulum tesquicola]